MDTIRLRTLTEKSTLGFGKYSDFTVGYVLAFSHTLYLRWVYYNCDMISFVPDILDQIRIPKEYRIEKPGKKPELHEIVNDILHKNMNGLSKIKQNSRNIKVKKAKIYCNNRIDRIRYSKGALQAKNHGH